MTKWKLSKSRSEREDDGVNGGDGREVGIDRREVNLPIRRMFGCKRRALRQEWYPHQRRGDKRKRGTSPFTVRGGDWEGKTALRWVKEKGGWGVSLQGQRGKVSDAWIRSTCRGEVCDLPVLRTFDVHRTCN